MKLHHKVDPAPVRRAAYMPVGDQLDAILKGFLAVKEWGVALPPETLAWIEHCQAVKAAAPHTD